MIMLTPGHVDPCAEKEQNFLGKCHSPVIAEVTYANYSMPAAAINGV